MFSVSGGDDDLKLLSNERKELLNWLRAVLSEVPAVGSIKVFESVNAIYTPCATIITLAELLPKYSPVPSDAINLNETD